MKPKKGNPMKPLVLAVLFSILDPLSSTLARMGESPAQIAARYGPVVGTNTTMNGESGLRYTTNDWHILVHYVKTGPNTWASDAEFFFREETITEVEIEALLQSQAQGARWRELHDLPTIDRVWKRSDGKAMAFKPVTVNALGVFTPDYWDSFERAERRKAREKTEGF
jgi:hypothetical protein